MEQPWRRYFPDEAQSFDLANMGAQTMSGMLDDAARKHGAKKALTTILPTGAETSITGIAP